MYSVDVVIFGFAGVVCFTIPRVENHGRVAMPILVVVEGCLGVVLTGGRLEV